MQIGNIVGKPRKQWQLKTKTWLSNCEKAGLTTETSTQASPRLSVQPSIEYTYTEHPYDPLPRTGDYHRRRREKNVRLR